jgi:hypothetical protein
MKSQKNNGTSIFLGDGFNYRVIGKLILEILMMVFVFVFLYISLYLISFIGKNYFYPLLFQVSIIFLALTVSTTLKLINLEIDFWSLILISMVFVFIFSVSISFLFIFIPLEPGNYIIPSQVIYLINFLLPFGIFWLIFRKKTKTN